MVNESQDPERAVAAAWLENLQRQVYETFGVNEMSRQESRRFLREFLHKALLAGQLGLTSESDVNAIIALMEEDKKSILTNYQDPGWYSIIRRMAAGIEQTLAEHERILPVKPLFGSLPTGRVNGFAAAVPNTNFRVILLEDGLFGFANLMCKAIAATFPSLDSGKEGRVTVSTDIEKMRQNLRSNGIIAQRFFDALVSYIVKGHPHNAEPYIPSGSVMALSDTLRESMETFVLAHEYGHVVAGHLGPAVPRRAMVANVGVETISTDWQQEFEADVIGLETMLAVRMKKGFDLSLSFWGADAFFGCIDVVEKTVSVLLYGEERPNISDTHPPTSHRRLLLRAVLAKTLEENVARGPLQLANIVETIINDLWLRVRPALVKMHEDGFRPTHSWTGLA
jgi:hypothetical protein